jgi:probable F420-dependent oxidoreductase
VKFDVSIPNAREGMSAPVGSLRIDDVGRAAKVAEELGFHGVWATDFITPTPCYKIPEQDRPVWLEPIVSLAYCAALTSRIRLGTGVLMAPFRDPVVLAKETATLDQLSGGRLTLGMGIGMCRDEFELVRPRAAGANRGRMLDEFIEALSLLLAPGEKKVGFSGKYIEFGEIVLTPKPVQPRLPIFVPGRVPGALERVVRYGLGIMLRVGMVPRQLAELRATGDRLGQDVSGTQVVGEVELRIARNAEQAVEEYQRSWQCRLRVERQGMKLEDLLRNNWIGTAEQILAKIDALAAQGVRHFSILSLVGDTAQERLDQMSMFAEDVLRRVGGDQVVSGH